MEYAYYAHQNCMQIKKNVPSMTLWVNLTACTTLVSVLMDRSVKFTPMLIAAKPQTMMEILHTTCICMLVHIHVSILEST